MQHPLGLFETVCAGFWLSQTLLNSDHKGQKGSPPPGGHVRNCCNCRRDKAGIDPSFNVVVMCLVHVRARARTHTHTHTHSSSFMRHSVCCLRDILPQCDHKPSSRTATVGPTQNLPSFLLFLSFFSFKGRMSPSQGQRQIPARLTSPFQVARTVTTPDLGRPCLSPCVV